MGFSVRRSLLKPLLDQAGITQSELARRTGISREMIVKYISLRSPMPIDKARKISKTLGVKIEDLYEWDDE
jgi:transcriptional regulator with XRE-family HTH domain